MAVRILIPHYNNIASVVPAFKENWVPLQYFSCFMFVATDEASHAKAGKAS